MIEAVLKGGFPAEHKAQCQGQLWVSGRAWIDLAIYWPGLPIFIVRAERDEAYIAELAGAVDAFNEELDRVIDRIAAYAQMEAA